MYPFLIDQRAGVAAVAAVVALLHLHRGTVLMRLDLDGEHAHHVVVQTREALHLLHGLGGCFGAHEGVMTLAVLVDLVGHRLDAPVFGADDLAAVVRKDGREMVDQALGLRAGQVLTRDHDMLVKRHAVSSSVGAHFTGQADHLPRSAHERLRRIRGMRQECGLIQALAASRKGARSAVQRLQISAQSLTCQIAVPSECFLELGDAMWNRWLDGVLRRFLRHGTLQLTYPDGIARHYGCGRPEVTVRTFAIPLSRGAWP
jgi:hypothetical protein